MGRVSRELQQNWGIGESVRSSPFPRLWSKSVGRLCVTLMSCLSFSNFTRSSQSFYIPSIRELLDAFSISIQGLCFR